MMFQFEKKVIDVILKTIKKHQEYLTQKENLPQLAKLGYMYNILWYAGRICWGTDGILSKSKRSYQCEDNPKYKIEMCEPINGDIENLIYDAWGMHVDIEIGNISWDEFSSLILAGKKLFDIEMKLLKLNKTFNDWVEILTDKNYKYSSLYPNKKSVANHLLCVSGNGYRHKNGFVTERASGADQDVAIYGDWKNVVFDHKILTIVNIILNIKEVEKTIQTAYLYRKEKENDKQEKKIQGEIDIFGMSIDDYIKSDKYKKSLKKISVNEKYSRYYPINEYSIISKFDKNTHISYINAGIKICKEIIQHKDEEGEENIEFAKNYLKKHQRPKNIKALLKNI